MELVKGFFVFFFAVAATLMSPALVLYACKVWYETRKIAIRELLVQETATIGILVLLIMFAPGWTLWLGMLLGIALLAVSFPNLLRPLPATA